MGIDQKKIIYGEFFGGEQIVHVNGRYYRFGRVADKQIPVMSGIVPVIYEGESGCYVEIPECYLLKASDPTIQKLIAKT